MIRFPVQVLSVKETEWKSKAGSSGMFFVVSCADSDGEVYRVRVFDKEKVPPKGHCVLHVGLTADMSEVRIEGWTGAQAQVGAVPKAA